MSSLQLWWVDGECIVFRYIEEAVRWTNAELVQRMQAIAVI